jgi:hypothetical protein
MVAPNRQPSGSKPGPAAVHTHPAHEGGSPSGGRVDSRNDGHSGEKGVASHGTPKPVGNGKKNPLH